MHNHSKKKCHIYQVFYDENSRRACDPQFIAYKNPHSSKYFENQIILDLYDQGKMSDCEFFGVVSWRIWQKVKKIPFLEKFIVEDEKSCDFYYANWWWGTTNSVWKQNEFWLQIDLTSWPKKIFEELGYKLDLDKLNILPSFYNYQICRTSLYRDYIENLLRPFMEIMEDQTRTDLQSWLFEPVPYVRAPSVTGVNGQILKALLSSLPFRRRDEFLKILNQFLGNIKIANPNKVSPQNLKNITGEPYYTKHSFVMEALFPTYAAFRGWTGKPFSR